MGSTRTTHPKELPLYPKPDSEPTTARVLRTEEKGSDVNLGSYLLWDAMQEGCKSAAVVTNDSDLKTPIRMLTEKLRIPVTVICPHERISKSLAQVATETRKTRESALRRSQFPLELRDAAGTVRCPPSWR